MPVRIVQSKQNPRLKELRKALAHPGRNDRGLVAIEGPNLVAEALRAGLRFDSIFCDGDSPTINYESDRALADIDILLVSGNYLQSILATETPQPVAAFIDPPDWTWAHILSPKGSSASLIVVLAALQDPGNLGTIIRSAEAFGANGIICLPGTVNPWNPKAVRASAGSIFRLPILNVSEDEALTQFREAGVRLLTTTVQGAQPADLVDLAEPLAILIGNEGNGVPADLAIKADMAITIPCPGPVESLNAAVAASVLLYEAARQRASKTGGPPERRGGAR
jgi:TrmH family RNA methyltransferase